MLPQSKIRKALEALEMSVLHRVGGPQWVLVPMAIELLIVAEMVASPIMIDGARVEQHLALCPLAFTHAR